MAQLAAETGTTPRVARILADSMAARGLLLRSAGSYRLTPVAAAYLGGDGAQLSLDPYLRFLDEISYEHWLQFDHSVQAGEPGKLNMDDGRWSTFIGGVMNYNALHARMLAASFDFTPYRAALDLGGLSSAFSIAAMNVNPELRTTFVYAPDFADGVRQQVAQAGLADRSEVAGEATAAAQPAGPFDLVMVNHVIHRFNAEENLAILRHARAAAAPGARLILLDFFLDDDEVQRPLDALHAAEYLVIDGTVVYPEAQVRTWLADAGWQPVDKLALPGSPRALIADAL